MNIREIIDTYPHGWKLGAGRRSRVHRWDDDYADAMRKVYAAFPEDDDVCALHAEALMTRTPWALRNLRSGDPAAGASMLEAIDVLESAMKGLEDYRPGAAPGHAESAISISAIRRDPSI